MKKIEAIIKPFELNEVKAALLELGVLAEEQVTPAVNSAIEAARTGEIGDGNIFATSVEQAIRLRTGEEGQKAA